ncbi:sce7726 family protein [Corynebacterium glucuronolyticum]|uniref:sce7726 family protein n=1 Tax=Corynebacterium glucuronolyticum TaxID=39791 RepID=UPI00191DF49F|nr:sce7726 family protein [Corynebacterium glucuronolyticum]QQU89067.1 sce7726 family protein [Corynebacterium glucuronolyticum]
MTREVGNTCDYQPMQNILNAAGLTSIDDAFRELARPGNRNDYVFRTAILQKEIIGRHKMSTSAILNEFRVNNSRVDLGIAHKSLTAFEIKSDLDSLKRLGTQLLDYSKFFRECYVVVSEQRAKQVQGALPEWCGAYVLTKRFTLVQEKPAEDLLEFNDPAVLCNSLRIDEAQQVLAAIDGQFPDMPNAVRRSYAVERFVEIGAETLSDYVRRALVESRKSSDKQIKRVAGLPKPFRAAYLSSKMSRNQQDNFFATIAGDRN